VASTQRSRFRTSTHLFSRRPQLALLDIVISDGNPVPNPTKVPVLWLGTAERISAIVEMNHPGVWILGDLDNDDRRHGMGIAVEYASRPGKAQWIAAPPFKWNYSHFAKTGMTAPMPDESIEMTFAKNNAAEEGFNRWTINGVAYPMSNETVPASAVEARMLLALAGECELAQ
jgi:FtsP/CotA-like multicopper oxidase with cupredoxin domain